MTQEPTRKIGGPSAQEITRAATIGLAIVMASWIGIGFAVAAFVGWGQT
jgi:hypothetical protein